MISKNKQKLVRSLERKKGRTEAGLFVAEGPKLVGELLAAGWQPAYVAATPQWRNAGLSVQDAEWDEVTADELERISLQKTPQEVLALFPLPRREAVLADVSAREICLALDGVQDPGNVGTIVRLADWFGIRHIFCSPSTADVFSPKAVQSTMGAIARVAVHYVDLPSALNHCPAPIFGTHLDGENLYHKPLADHGVIVMGNEGRGITPQVSTLVTHRLFIPPFPPDRPTVESLNVAIATAVVCAEFRRRAL